MGGIPSLQKEQSDCHSRGLQGAVTATGEEAHLRARTNSESVEAPRNDLQVKFFH